MFFDLYSSDFLRPLGDAGYLALPLFLIFSFVLLLNFRFASPYVSICTYFNSFAIVAISISLFLLQCLCEYAKSVLLFFIQNIQL